MRTSLPKDWGRTRGLQIVAVCAGLSIVYMFVQPVLNAVAVSPPAYWSNPATWGGHLPGPSSKLTVDGPIIVDADALVAGINITSRGSLTFEPSKSHTLSSTGNIVNDGLIEMKPASAAIVQTIQFVNVDESKFVGGIGTTPIASDVGLWTEKGGRLNLAGTPKTSWTSAAGPVARGASKITVLNDAGWRVGDHLAITPTGKPSAKSSTAYDYAVVTWVNGNTVSISAATEFEHPAVTVAPGQTMTAEVLNLSRNVRLSGQPNHRAHVWIHSTVPTPQVVDYVEISHMGPRQTNPDGTTHGVTGRYGLHFHDSMENSVGSTVTGTVVRDTGFHAFVPHMSDGITFSGDIAHATMDEAFWWDSPTSNTALQDPTNHLTLDHNLASMVWTDPPYRGALLAGFVLGRGAGNVARGNVAVGIQGTQDAAGFQWPALTNGSEGVWTFEDNVAHNNAQSGIFTWQNTGGVHVINRFTGYYNGLYGIRHGAYRNAFVYENSVLYGNGVAGLDLHAQSLSGTYPRLTFSNLLLDGAGISPFAITTDRHDTALGAQPTIIANSVMRGYRKAGVGVIYVPGDSTAPERIDFVNDTWSGNEFWFAKGVMAASRIRVEDSVHGSIMLAPPPVNAAGVKINYKAPWNADFWTIPPFGRGVLKTAATASLTSSVPGASPSFVFCHIP